jgi:hypothetical protein
MVWFATSRPITAGITRAAKDSAGPTNHAGTVEAALRPSRSKARTQIAAAETPTDMGSTAAGEAATTKATTVTAPAASTGKAISDSKSCEKNCDCSRSHYLIARH